MKRLALAGCVAALLLAWASPASAETVPLGSRQDTSKMPSVFIAPEDLERAESFVVTVTAEPVQALKLQDYVSCTRGSETISLQGIETTITPPFTTTILPTLSEPDRCWIDASAETSIDTGLPGTLKIEVTGNRRPAPVPAPAPSTEGRPAAEPPPAGGTSPLEAGLLQALAGHGRYRGLSITGPNSAHPIRRPRELTMSFRTLNEYVGESSKANEYAVLGWKLNCNSHSYKAEVTSTRLNLSDEVETRKRCLGPAQLEERWLERFFAASPHWRLENGRLTLTARGSRIVMRHPQPRAS